MYVYRSNFFLPIGIQLAQNISGASVSGVYIGSTELEFHPNKLRAGNYSADTKTAG